MDVRKHIRSAIRSIPDFPKPGIQFKDITPILEDPVLSKGIILEFMQLFKNSGIDAVAGIESRGFLYGLPLAIELNVPFIVIRKKGKLPAKTVSHKYDLEYGSAEIEMHRGAVQTGMEVLIHDDLLATGGTASAAAKLIEKEGGIVSGFSFLIELTSLKGRQNLHDYAQPIISLVDYD